MLWIDKHCPKRLSELQCHPQLTQLLSQLALQKDIPHLLFYGPSGGGKSTRILALLRETFGTSIDRMKTDTYSHKESNTEIMISQSQNHMLVPCPDLGSKDRIIVQQLIKDLSSNAGALSFFTKGPTYRVFVFQDAEALSDVAQAGLRRTLEKYVRNARVILHVEHLSSIITPLRSRCLCIRVPLPEIAEIKSVLTKICTFENLTANDDFLNEIATRSERNLRRAILTLETAATHPNINHFKDWSLPWEIYISGITDKIVEKQSPKVIGECRDMIYDLLACCIPGDVILQTLAKKLCGHPSMAVPVKPHIFHAAAHFSHTMSLGTKEVWHIEAFIAQIMHTMKSIELLG